MAREGNKLIFVVITHKGQLIQRVEGCGSYSISKNLSTSLVVL